MFVETLTARGDDPVIDSVIDSETSLKAFVLKAFMQAVVVLMFVSSDRYNYSLWNDPNELFINTISSTWC